jgi:hypothetical protein
VRKEDGDLMGRFVKGQSGNPGGRAKVTPEMSRALEVARENAPKAIQIFVDIIDGKYTIEEKMKAAAALLDRGLGKPTQQTDVNLDAKLDGTLETTGKVDEKQLEAFVARVSSELEGLATKDSAAKPGKK